MLTSSSKRMPAHGKPACTGSAAAATSPTSLKRFSHLTILLAFSFRMNSFPASAIFHLSSRQHRCFSLAAATACLSAESMSPDVRGIKFSRIAQSLSESRLRTISNILSLEEGFVVAGCEGGMRMQGFGGFAVTCPADGGFDNAKFCVNNEPCDGAADDVDV